MKILFLTGHSFHPNGRKASIHFLASGLHRLGNETYILTVGTSLARMAMYPQRNKGTLSYLNWRHDEDGLWKRVHIDVGHQPARDRGIVSRILRMLSSRNLPRWVLRRVGQVDAVVLDSGLAVTYYDFIRRTYPSAFIMYNAADSLSGVGYSGRILDEEHRVLATADAVRTPSALLAREFPATANCFLVPHGVDKSVLLKDLPSPYPPGSLNAVLVGSTLLDREALVAIAKAAPQMTIHVFGVTHQTAGPANLVLHGEVAFNHLASFLQHASIALAPYKLEARNAYIAESSLKIRQYRVCGLPIVCPATLTIEGPDVFHYASTELATVSDMLDAALARGRQPYLDSLPNWDEVARDIEFILAGNGPETLRL